MFSSVLSAYAALLEKEINPFIQVHWAPLWLLPWILFWEYCLSLVCLFLVLGFWLTPLFGTYFSVTSFCLILCVYFSILSKLYMLILEKWLYVWKLQWGWHPPPLASPELYAPNIPLCGLCGPILLQQGWLWWVYWQAGLGLNLVGCQVMSWS